MGALLITSLFHTTELINWLRHPRAVQTIKKHVPLFDAVISWLANRLSDNEQEHTLFQCQGKGIMTRIKPIKERVETI
jgi:hypothetical protein